MKKLLTIHSGVMVELCEYVKDFYLIAEVANQTMDRIRRGLPTWVSAEKYEEMNISVWVYHDERVCNAFCSYENGRNIIALSVGLLKAFWDMAEDFVYQEEFSSVFRLSDENKPRFVNELYLYMLVFIIAHEFGHIAHGHLRGKGGANCIDEAANMSAEGDVKSQRERNWITQLLEYDADSFAAAIQSLLFLQRWEEDLRVTLANFDVMFVANYLCFRVFAENTGRDFHKYLSKEIDEYDHPHPGIRMYYSLLHFADWIWRIHGINEDTMRIVSSGSHAIMSYERNVLGKDSVKDCYYTVAFTQKGSQHFMCLHNGWRELTEDFNRLAYIPIEKMEEINSMPISVDENGNLMMKKQSLRSAISGNGFGKEDRTEA